MSINNITINVAEGRDIIIETGKMALLAHGAVTIRQGDTIVLVAACSADPRPGLDFFPLQVDYREKFSAAGRMPGGYFKREGRPSEKEILTARMIDRPIRALFPEGYVDDVQVQVLLLSADGENEPDVLSMLGASAALCLSDMPFDGPVGAVRVGRVNGKFIANPTHTEMEESDLDLVYSGTIDRTIMIEGSAKEVSEEVLRDALIFANEMVKKQVAAQLELAAIAGKPKKTPTITNVPVDLAAAVERFCTGKIRDAAMLPGKEERYAALDALYAQVKEGVTGTFGMESEEERSIMMKRAFTELTRMTIRRLLLDEGKRSDGRAIDEIREISCEVGVLPRTHGSALFARGETQALVITTFGASSDSQGHDAITGGPSEKSFFLHYNFPNFSVGETGRIAGPGRREIGHGALAERSVAQMVPQDSPYAIRSLSEVMGSNGSTSMASVCGASLALMDAGVKLPKHVAGITCGLVKEGEQTILLTDILGSEDHYGDMDFKVAGTVDGITGFQLDLKIAGISIDLMYQGLLRNKTARMQILEKMNACISEPRAELSPFAPRVEVIKINPEKIAALIGPGGKVIRGITEAHDVKIDIEDDGTVMIFATNGEKMQGGLHAVHAVTAEVEVGRIYRGQVKTIKDFGAFVEVLPGQDGLLHISEMADFRVNKVEDIIQLGDYVSVKVIDIDERGRMRLSRRAALAEME